MDHSAVSELLERAAALPARPGRSALRELGSRLATYADTVDVAHAASLVSAEEPRFALAVHPEGPLVGLRRYEPGEVSTVHSHAWTILVALDGDGTLERWSGADKSPAWTHAEKTGGRPVVIDGDEAHRQRTRTGALELVLIAGAEGRREYEPDADAVWPADVFDTFITAWTGGDAASLGPLYDDQAFLDLHVPQWRVQVEGSAKIAKFVAAEEFREGYHVPSWSATRLPDGFVIEVESRFQHGNGEGHSEMVHLVRTDGPGGPIVHHAAYCTGIWDERTREGLRQSGGLLRP